MGIRIKKLRKSKNLTTEELGEKIGLTRTGIINYENGDAYPSRNALLKLVSIFGEDVLCDDYSKFITTEYGQIIRQWRIKNNLSCEQAARYFDISIRTLYSIKKWNISLVG